MNNFFDSSNGLMGLMSKLMDVVILSLLWSLCSLPIVTMGVATTALYYTAVKVIRRDRNYVFQSFFKSFKENFAQGMLLWLFFLAIMAVLGINLRFSQGLMAQASGKMLGFILSVLYCLMGLVAVFAALYMLPVLSRFTMKKRQILKMSLFMSVRHLPYTFLLAAIAACVIVGMAYVPAALFFLPVAGTLLYSIPMEKLLKKYVKPEEADSGKDEWYLE